MNFRREIDLIKKRLNNIEVVIGIIEEEDASRSKCKSKPKPKAKKPTKPKKNLIKSKLNKLKKRILN